MPHGEAGFPPHDAVGCHTVSLGCFPSWSQSVVYSSSQNAVSQNHLSAETAWAEGLACCCHFTHTVWVGLLVYLSWELSYHLDAKSWPHCTQEALAESWRSRAVGIAACWIVAGLRSGWHHPASSAGAKLLSAPCLCHTHPQGASASSFSCSHGTVKTAFFPTRLLLFLARQTVPVRRYYWWYW